MRPRPDATLAYQTPLLLPQARELSKALSALPVEVIKDGMKLSDDMAAKTKRLIDEWSDEPSLQRPAIDSFLGDIYSGLQTQTMSDSDRNYANNHLYILSGLYGVLRALDSIHPYRLEMGYRLKSEPLSNLYNYWGSSISKLLPDDKLVINLAAAEYSKVVLPYLTGRTIVSPKFLTIHPNTKQPTFVVVHAKIARGAFAHWLITQRIHSLEDIATFTELGYRYSTTDSTPEEPVFICESFQGLGLSVRLT